MIVLCTCHFGTLALGRRGKGVLQGTESPSAVITTAEEAMATKEMEMAEMAVVTEEEMAMKMEVETVMRMETGAETGAETAMRVEAETAGVAEVMVTNPVHDCSQYVPHIHESLNPKA